MPLPETQLQLKEIHPATNVDQRAAGVALRDQEHAALEKISRTERASPVFLLAALSTLFAHGMVAKSAGAAELSRAVAQPFMELANRLPETAKSTAAEINAAKKHIESVNPEEVSMQLVYSYHTDYENHHNAQVVKGSKFFDGKNYAPDGKNVYISSSVGLYELLSRDGRNHEASYGQTAVNVYDTGSEKVQPTGEILEETGYGATPAEAIADALHRAVEVAAVHVQGIDISAQYTPKNTLLASTEQIFSGVASHTAGAIAQYTVVEVQRRADGYEVRLSVQPGTVVTSKNPS